MVEHYLFIIVTNEYQSYQNQILLDIPVEQTTFFFFLISENMFITGCSVFPWQKIKYLSDTALCPRVAQRFIVNIYVLTAAIL